MKDMTTETAILHFDHDKLEAMGISTSGIKASALSEEFRAMKRIILGTAFFEKQDNETAKNRIMITSIGEGDGKTFCALNLARSISFERNKQALLVDVNVLSPSIHNFMTEQAEIGLIDHLSDVTVSVGDVIHKTDIDNLRVIPMGKNHTLANELFSSGNMESLMAEFHDRYDDRVVIFDAPPLHNVNETYTLARYVDQIVIVIPDGQIKVNKMQAAIAKLPKHVTIHFVLNKTLETRIWQSTPVDDEFSENDKVLTGSSAFN
jgi:receptor protein-tyrosine kinase